MTSSYSSDTHGEMLDISLNSSTHTGNAQKDNQNTLTVASSDVEKINEVSMDKNSNQQGTHSPSAQDSIDRDKQVSEDKEVYHRTAPSEETILRKPLSGNSDHVVRERRRYFEEAVRERMAGVLKWNRVPTLFSWDNGNKSGIPPLLPEWLGVCQSVNAKENLVPKVCEILLESCIRDYKAAGEKIVTFDDLLQQARHHIRSIMPSDLRVGLSWLHRTGYIYVLEGESELYVSSENVDEVKPVLHDEFPSEAAFPLINCPDNEKNVPSHIVNSSPLRSLGKFPLLKTKVVLDISWFFGSVLGSILSPRDVLPPSIQHQLPWGDKDYLLSLRQLTALCESNMGPIQEKISTPQLICIIENMMLGAWCSSNYLFIPARVSGDKLRWLRQREISRMPLSQFGIGSGLPPVSAVIGRRVDIRLPYLLPSGMFHVLQCLLLQQYERGEWAGMSISCWDNGIGIVANVPRKSSKSQSRVPRTVCAIIEQIPSFKSVGARAAAVDGMLHAGVQASGITDIIAWGDSADCPVSAVQVLLQRCMRAVEQAVLIVLAWPPKPKKYVREGRDSTADIEDTSPPVCLYRSGGLSEDEEKFLSRVLCVEFLRPGCIMHTLALTPDHRDCAVYEDESLVSVGISSPFITSKSNDQLPIFVCCDHLQPRLCKHHLVNGYILADTPGGGRAILRSVSGALERTLGSAASIGTERTAQSGRIALSVDWNNAVVEENVVGTTFRNAAPTDDVDGTGESEHTVTPPGIDKSQDDQDNYVLPSDCDTGDGKSIDVSATSEPLAPISNNALIGSTETE